MTPLEVQQLRKALDDRDLEPASRQIILQRLSGGEAPAKSKAAKPKASTAKKAAAKTVPASKAASIDYPHAQHNA